MDFLFPFIKHVVWGEGGLATDCTFRLPEFLTFNLLAMLSVALLNSGGRDKWISEFRDSQNYIMRRLENFKNIFISAIMPNKILVEEMAKK